MYDTIRAGHMRSIHALKLDRTHKDTMRDIRALGVGVTYDAETCEYTLAWIGHGDELCTYFTTCREDAYNTARVLTSDKHNRAIMAAMLAS